MIETEGAGSERAGPFPLVEPVGILWGEAALAALEAGSGLRLAGGAGVFTFARVARRIIPAIEAARDWPEAIGALTAPTLGWAGLGRGPHIMAILNVTPDSFSDGGTHHDAGAAIAAGLAMLEQGAAVIDVGGESTRPGATAVPASVEQARVLPIIEALARAGAVVSIDTRSAETMARALDVGARIVNDVSALRHDPAAVAVVAQAGCPVLLMHMRGTPATMQALATYEDVAAEVVAELAARVEAVEAAGIARSRIAVDPGFGFAKTAEQSLLLLRRLPALAALGLPIVAGLSRKSMIGWLANEPVPARRDAASMAAHLACLDQGAQILRVHNVATTRQGIAIWRALRA